MSMLSSLGRSGDSKLRSGARARQKPVGAHIGSRQDFLCRHEQAARKAMQLPRKEREPILATFPEYIADTRTLKIAFDDLKQQGGQAPGPNSLRYDDLDRFEEWELIETLSKALKDGTYRPGPTRSVKIPKSSGGTRTLTLANIEDRIVAKASLLVIQPYLDATFQDRSFGCRPGRDRLDALAHARYQAEALGHLNWVVEDIKSAFDSIPLGRLRDLLLQLLPEDLCKLIESSVCKMVGGKRMKRGIQQGNALSPLLLNLYLNHHLDEVWIKKFPETPLLRTVDDILVTARNEEQALEAQQGLHDILIPVGMPLQDTKSHAADLTREEGVITWLGYELGWDGKELQVRIPESSWRELEQAFIDAWKSSFPSQQVEARVLGWVTQLGPAFPEHEDALFRIYLLASKYGHEELPCREYLIEVWKKAYRRREDTYRELLVESVS